MPIRHTIVLLDPTDISAPRPAEALSRPQPPPAARCGLSAASWAAYAGPSRQREARWPISVAQEDATVRGPEGSICTIRPRATIPPRTRIPLRIRQRQARQEWLLLRVTSVVLILLAGAMAVFIALMIAGYH